MRKITYTCDRCGKPLNSKLVFKLNVAKQKGSDTVEKKSFDFCSPCFLHVKTAFQDALKMEEMTEEKPTSLKADPVDQITEQTVEKPAIEITETKLITGPISDADRTEILRLYIQDELSPEDIAVKMHRLPRGIKRAINTALKTGEMEMLRERFLHPAAEITDQVSEPEPEKGVVDDSESEKAEEEDDKDRGFIASNARVLKDGYTAPPKTELINGKRYDIGSILALARAGWSAAKIADERHYDTDIVQYVIETYL